MELSDRSGLSLWRFGRVVLTAAIVLTNLVGACVVVVVAYFVVPLPPVDDVASTRWVNAIAAMGYVAFAVPVGAFAGTRGLSELREWLVSERVAGPREQRQVLRAPLKLSMLQVGLWFGAALLFGGLNCIFSVALGVVVAVTVAITGVTTAACAYLLAERLLRAQVARALDHDMPERLAVPGVATRAVLAWALGTGLPVLGLVGIGVVALAGGPASRTRLEVAMIVLGGIGIIVGLIAVVLAARATADPVDAVRRALQRVERGELDVHVPVNDGTQIGRLQLGFNRMVDGLAERERIREALGTYVDPSVAERIIREGTDLAGEEVEVTVMFVDVRGFTAFAERTPATDVVAAINRLFEQAVPIIQQHGGRVDKFVGDGLMAVFGAPRRMPDHADCALAAARAIAQVVEAGDAGPLRIGIGLNSGTVVAGNVGGAGRLEFGVIGDAVNLAARVESATRQTGDVILLTEHTRALLARGADGLVAREALPLKGKAEAVCLYAVPAGT